MKRLITVSLFLMLAAGSSAQRKTENVIVVTFDGLRWQELFGGADSVLIDDSLYSRNAKGLKKNYWAPDFKERRRKLLPFIWNEVAAKGQIYGNRNLGSKVNNKNPYWFSYPGYNEIFTGYPDTLVNSNDKNYNKNETVLGFINAQPAFKGKVAAFTSWDVFDYILNEPQSGVYVSSGFDSLAKGLLQDPALKLLNEMQFLSPRLLGNGVRPDFMTYFIAKNYLLKKQPRVLYIGFDETDDFAHEGNYNYYLYGAQMIDKWLKDLWSTVQQMPQYQDKTTLIITTDHGRGDKVKADWKHHGAAIPDAGQIWIAVMGPDTTPNGEVNDGETYYQEQIAATIAKLLGLDFKANHSVAPPISPVYQK